MGRGDRKTKARRDRAQLEQLAGLPSLAPTPRRELDKGGKSTRKKREVKSEAGVDKVALEARARQMGRKLKAETTRDGAPNRENIRENKETLNEMRRQDYGDHASQAIALVKRGQRRADMIAAFRGFQAAEERYTRVVLGKSMFAKGAKIEMAPEPITTSAEDAPRDTRTEDERHRDAVNSWRVWHCYTMRMAPNECVALYRATRGLVELHRDGALTKHGEAFLAAMAALCASMATRKK